MNNKNTSLIRITNQELTTKYQQTLQEKYNQLKQAKIKNAYREYPETSFATGFFSTFSKNNPISWENAERKKLMQVSESEVFALAIESFQTQTQQLTIWASEAVKNVIDNNQLEIKAISEKLAIKETSLMEKNQLVKNLEVANTNLQVELTTTQELLADAKKRLGIYFDQLQASLSHSSQKTITSNEYYLSIQLKELKNKYSNLELTNLSTEDLLRQKRIELKEYIKLAEKLAENEDNFQNQIISLSQKLQAGSIEKTLLEISLKEAQIRVESLTNRVNDFQRQKLGWEAEKVKAREVLAIIEENRQKNTEIFNQTALENAQLKAEKIELVEIITKGLKQVENLNETIAQKDQQITKLTESLQSENRKKKVLTVSNWIRYGSSYFVNDKCSQRIDTTITSWQSYYVIKDVDNWSYEVMFMILGVLSWKLTKRICNWLKKNNQQKRAASPKPIEPVIETPALINDPNRPVKIKSK